MDAAVTSLFFQQLNNLSKKMGKLPEDEEEKKESMEDKELWEKLQVPVTDLELSVRSSNCLKEAKIKTIGDMVRKTEMEMLKYRNFGKKSLSEIQKILQDMGLSFGMKIPKKTNQTSPGISWQLVPGPLSS